MQPHRPGRGRAQESSGKPPESSGELPESTGESLENLLKATAFDPAAGLREQCSQSNSLNQSCETRGKISARSQQGSGAIGTSAVGGGLFAFCLCGRAR
eukprot:15458916-Alexandrium_andersonii.AAC.1